MTPLAVFVDSDVLIAGLFSTKGASQPLRVLGETGRIELVIPAAAVNEARRNLEAKLPVAVLLFDRLLNLNGVHIQAAGVRIVRPGTLFREIRAWMAGFGR